MAKSWSLEPNFRTTASDRRPTTKPGLASSLCGWHSCTRPPARSWWKKGGEEEEKLGRSRGGFSTKIHIRCEGKGKPITFILSPGQRNESIFRLTIDGTRTSQGFWAWSSPFTKKAEGRRLSWQEVRSIN